MDNLDQNVQVIVLNKDINGRWLFELFIDSANNGVSLRVGFSTWRLIILKNDKQISSYLHHTTNLYGLTPSQ